MSARDGWDELVDREFAAAEERVKRQEIPDGWGPLRQTAEGDRILTRYLGSELVPPFGDVVFRFVDYPGEPRPFHLRRTAQLESVLENAQLGDIVGHVRGRDTSIGIPNPMQTWDGWERSSDEPLGPAAPAAAADRDLPF
jgi:hypothetical protein